MKDREFYQHFQAAAEQAEHSVRIAYLAPYPPSDVEYKERKRYYDAILSLMKRRDQVNFKRLVRSSPKNDAWLASLVRETSGTPADVDLAVLTRDLEPEVELPLALSVQVIDKDKVWVVATASHETQNEFRDVFVQNNDFAAAMTEYYDRVWSVSQRLLDRGRITEQGQRLLADQNDSETRAKGRSPALLLSIRPEHAHRIFSGSKRFELRKVLPVTDFNRVFLYETGGKGIVGWFDVGEIIRQPIDELWKTVGNAATSHDRFFAYFSTAREGYAIAIRNARRFQGPISANGLNGDRLKLQPPQSFIILEPGQPFWTLLEGERQRTLQRELPTVQLKKITSSQRTLYKKQVMKHVGANYEGIDETFAEANLRIHDLGFDPAGFFTKRKEVLSINNERNVCIGFTTLTYKSGDCVKTGPTILLPRYRSRGYGQAARKAIEEICCET